MKIVVMLFTTALYLLLLPTSYAKPQSMSISSPQTSYEQKDQIKKKSSREKGLTRPASSKIDLNQADVNMLTKLIKGVGSKRAESIVNHRASHGPFKSFDELSKVKGLGEKFVKLHLKELENHFTISSK